MNFSKYFIMRTKITLGKVFSWKTCLDISLTLQDLSHHQYILGATGTGKSTLIAREVIQAFENGICCLVIDPHGDLAYEIVEGVAPEFIDGVFLLDPLRVKFSLNPLELPEYRDNEGRNLIVERMIGEMIDFFIKLYGKQYWGPSLNRIFQEGLRALYEKDDAPTLKDLYDLLSGNLSGYRDFSEELKKLPRGRTDSVLNKLIPFVKNKLLKRIFCQKISSVNLSKLLRSERLVVFRLPKGELSEINTLLIGSTIITKTWFFAISREKRFPIILAIDEFQNFAHLETLRNIVAEGRKYGIALLIAHQHTKQIHEKILEDLLANTGTKIIFRVSGEDALTIAKSFGIKDKERFAEILTNLPNGKALVKLRGGFGKEAKTFEISTLPLFKRNNYIDFIIKRMNELFSVPEEEEREDVEPDVYELLNVIDRVLSQGKEAKVSELFEEYRKIKPSIKASEISNLLDKAERLGFVKRNVVKQVRGRPKIVVELTEKGREVLGYKGLGTSAKAGGDLHRAMILRYAEILKSKGYVVQIQEQKGKEEQSDLIAFKRIGDKWIEIGVEVEIRADHPDQVLRNYEKNVLKGREVIFVVPDDKVAERVKRILGDREKYYVIVERIA